MRQTDQEEHNVMGSEEDDDRRASDDPESAEEATNEESTGENPGTEPEGSGARAAPLSATGPDGQTASHENVTVT